MMVDYDQEGFMMVDHDCEQGVSYIMDGDRDGGSWSWMVIVVAADLKTFMNCDDHCGDHL